MARSQSIQLRAKLVAFIAEYTTEHGYPPALDDMATAVGISTRGHVHYHLSALKEQGQVTWEPRLMRTVRVLGPEERS